MTVHMGQNLLMTFKYFLASWTAEWIFEMYIFNMASGSTPMNSTIVTQLTKKYPPTHFIYLFVQGQIFNLRWHKICKNYVNLEQVGKQIAALVSSNALSNFFFRKANTVHQISDYQWKTKTRPGENQNGQEKTRVRLGIF